MGGRKTENKRIVDGRGEKGKKARQGGVLQRELEGIGAEQSLFVLISRRLEEAMISLFFM